jgi:hypothetical protein
MSTQSSYDRLVPRPGSGAAERCCPHPLKDHGRGVGCHRCSCTRRGPARAQGYSPRLLGLPYSTVAGIALGVGCVAAVAIAAFVFGAGSSTRSTGAAVVQGTAATDVSRPILALVITPTPTPTPSSTPQSTPTATPKPRKRAKRRSTPAPPLEFTPAPAFVLRTPIPPPASPSSPPPPTATPVCWGVNSEGRYYRIPCAAPSP